jgi:hypothetical protein
LLYRVVVELWEDGQRCESSGFDLGFRATGIAPSSVFVNAQPLSLRGMAYLPQSREQACNRRAAGYNLVVAGKGQWHWWIKANPMGFLLLEKAALSALTPQYIGLLAQQPCFLGFLVGGELLAKSGAEIESFLRPWQERGVLIGLELGELPPPSLPGGLSFIVCPESALPTLGAVSIPKLAVRKCGAGKESQPATAFPGVLGWIDE